MRAAVRMPSTRTALRRSGRRNDLLISLLDGLWDKADRYRRATLETREDSPADRARVLEEHQAMMDAVLDGDPGAAEEHMRRHVAKSRASRNRCPHRD